jgi:hypothetical protein
MTCGKNATRKNCQESVSKCPRRQKRSVGKQERNSWVMVKMISRKWVLGAGEK